MAIWQSLRACNYWPAVPAIVQLLPTTDPVQSADAAPQHVFKVQLNEDAAKVGVLSPRPVAVPAINNKL